MTQEEKQLLLKDLCARFPYGIIICRISDNSTHKFIHSDIAESIDMFSHFLEYSEIDDIKPYLRPMSSMTEEEMDEYTDIKKGECNGCVLTGKGDPDIEFLLVDWLNIHHFDYRGLIEKGLALEAPEGMYEQ